MRILSGGCVFLGYDEAFAKREDVLEAMGFQEGVGIVAGNAFFFSRSFGEIPIVAGCRRGHTAEEAGKLTWCAQAGMFLTDEFLNNGEIFAGGIGCPGGGELVRRTIPPATRALPAGFHFFSKMGEERLVEAVGRKGLIDDVLQAGKVRCFPLLEKLNQAIGESGEGIWFFEKTRSLSELGSFDDEVAKILKFGEDLRDFLSGFSAGVRSFAGIDFPPPVVIPCRWEKNFEKGLLSRITTCEEMFP